MFSNKYPHTFQVHSVVAVAAAVAAVEMME
jgi:hypothetical protein